MQNAAGRHAIARTAPLAATLAAAGLLAGACSSADTDSGTDGVATTGAAAADDYRDGEYSATGSYNTPGGEQSIGVTVTLSNSVITALTIDNDHTTGPSKQFQDQFKSGIDELVIGKNINDLDVSKVSGSSLTSRGFNQAIAEIQGEAAE